jgi:hypothetical protein
MKVKVFEVVNSGNDHVVRILPTQEEAEAERKRLLTGNFSWFWKNGLGIRETQYQATKIIPEVIRERIVDLFDQKTLIIEEEKEVVISNAKEFESLQKGEKFSKTAWLFNQRLGKDVGYVHLEDATFISLEENKHMGKGYYTLTYSQQKRVPISEWHFRLDTTVYGGHPRAYEGGFLAFDIEKKEYVVLQGSIGVKYGYVYHPKGWQTVKIGIKDAPSVCIHSWSNSNNDGCYYYYPTEEEMKKYIWYCYDHDRPNMMSWPKTKKGSGLIFVK